MATSVVNIFSRLSQTSLKNIFDKYVYVRSPYEEKNSGVLQWERLCPQPTLQKFKPEPTYFHDQIKNPLLRWPITFSLLIHRYIANGVRATFRTRRSSSSPSIRRRLNVFRSPSNPGPLGDLAFQPVGGPALPPRLIAYILVAATAITSG